MDIPYGFDCFAFERDQIKYFEPNLSRVKHSITMNRGQAPPPPDGDDDAGGRHLERQFDYVRFTRKNEDYTKQQMLALARVGRLNATEMDGRIFCGIKIQIGLALVTNFLRRGLQYKAPVSGRATLVNGSWTGIVRGLTVERRAPIAYDVAFGNFLAWDEEFPYIKFGPFVAIESKLVMLTGGSRRIELSSFGTNIHAHIWLALLSFLFLLSLLASLWIDWRTSGHHRAEATCPLDDHRTGGGSQANGNNNNNNRKSFLAMFHEFFFIYFTMLLNKPCVEFDELIWPKQVSPETSGRRHKRRPPVRQAMIGKDDDDDDDDRVQLLRARKQYRQWLRHRRKRTRGLPSSIRVVSYLWSAACLIMASIYSGEMLAVMLLHADQNIDTISQLINSRPPIEPVIRQDDFTHTLMLNSLDENMLRLYNKTRVIPRAQVYSRQFIESVSQRKQALLGDDELIETIYDIYHKYYPLYKSRMTYLQYPISIMYRKDLNGSLERPLRRGMVQMFEMGLIHRWYQAQKDTYIKFYDTYERKALEGGGGGGGGGGARDRPPPVASSNSEQNYKPLSMHHFRSFYKAFVYCGLAALAVLLVEIIVHKRPTRRPNDHSNSTRITCPGPGPGPGPG